MANSITASMGPRHLSRGIHGFLFCFIPTQVGFNGATASEPWNLTRPNATLAPLFLLQWGHGI